MISTQHSTSLINAGAADAASARRRANVGAVSAKPGVFGDRVGFADAFGGGVLGGVSGSSRVRGSSSTDPVPGEASRLPRAKDS